MNRVYGKQIVSQNIIFVWLNILSNTQYQALNSLYFSNKIMTLPENSNSIFYSLKVSSNQYIYSITGFKIKIVYM